MRLVLWVVLAWFGLTAIFALAMVGVALWERAERGRDRREFDPSGVIDPLWNDFQRWERTWPSGDIDPLWSDFDRAMRRPR